MKLLVARCLLLWAVLLSLSPATVNHVQAAPQLQADQCDSLAQEGVAFYRQAEYPQALQKFQDALTCYRTANNRKGEGAALYIIGSIYSRLGQYQEALKYYEPALAIRREIGDRVGEGYSLNNIGFIYARLGQYQEALKYHEQSLSILREIGDRAGRIVDLVLLLGLPFEAA